MAVASIRINQPTHSTTPTGQAGRGRNDLELGKPVLVRNVDDTDVNRWRWQLRDVPIGSAAVLSDSTQPTVTFTPDVEGSYRITLSVNDGGPGEVTTKVGAVLNAAGERYPATGERADEVDWDVGGTPNPFGWGKDAEKILRAIAVPQYLSALTTESVTNGSASEIVVVGGLGLPDDAGDITAVDWVDYTGGNAGAPPTINGYSFTDIPGENSLVSLCTVGINLNTTGSTVGDFWALILITTTGNRLVSLIELV